MRLTVLSAGLGSSAHLALQEHSRCLPSARPSRKNPGWTVEHSRFAGLKEGVSPVAMPLKEEQFRPKDCMILCNKQAAWEVSFTGERRGPGLLKARQWEGMSVCQPQGEGKEPTAVSSHRKAMATRLPRPQNP